MEYIPYGRQNISESDIREVVKVLKSDYITQGPMVPGFERAIADYCKVKHVIACNSATSGLHLACLAVGVTRGDVVWTSPITFVASANCALYCGAQVDFVDIDPRSYNISVEKLEEKLVHSKKKGCLPKAVIPVHICGQSCQMDQIFELSKKYKFKIIEDASHAIGGKYKGKPVGCGDYSDAAVLSFHPVKIITTGEGGAVLTNDDETAKRVSLLRSHGITRDETLMQRDTDGAWYYEMLELGFNYRMTDIQAALGVSQMKRLDEFVARRQKLVEIYNQSLRDVPVTTPLCLDDCSSANHLYVMRIKSHKKEDHRKFFDHMRSNKIGVNLHYIPVHMQPYYRKKGFREGMFPEAEKYYEEAISLPLFPDLQEKELERVVDAVARGLQLISQI